MDYIKTTEKIEVKDYPYGFRLRTTAFYSIEHKPGKGFRSVFQTINPKNGKLNKPKFSTYYPVMVLFRNDEGHIKTSCRDFYGDEGMVRDLKWLSENYELFTKDQIKSIAVTIIAILKASVYAKVVYTHSDQTKLLELFDSAVTTMVEIAKTGDNLFGSVTYDIPAIKALEQKDFNPFKVVRVN